MISIRCKDCNKELTSYSSKPVSCGCPNMATISGDKIFANDLTKIVMLNAVQSKSTKGVLSNEDMMWQAERKKRKVKKLDFEIR